MNPVHTIDPFAPVDDPRHPANFGRAPEVDSERPPEPLRFDPEDFAILVSQFPADLETSLEQNPASEETLQDLLDERLALFGVYGTPEEHEAAEVVGEYPDVAELRARHTAHREELIAARPKRDDPKADWVAYYRKVFPEATEEDAEAFKLPELRDLTRLDDSDTTS